MPRQIEQIRTTFNEITHNINFYVEKFLTDSVFGFKQIYLNNEQQLEVMSLLGDRLNWVPNSENKMEFSYTEDHSQTLRNHGNPTKNDLIIDWHLEHFNYKYSQVAGAWNMKTFTCHPDCGKTGFVHVGKIFNDMPENWKTFLENCKLINYIKFSEKYGYICQFPNGKFFKSFVRDAVMNHPNLSVPILRLDTRGRGYFETQKLMYVENRRPTEDELFLFDEIFNFYIKEIWENKNRQMWWEWSEGDMIIHDVLSLTHSATGGFLDGQRIFDGMWAFPNVPEVINCTREFIDEEEI